MSYVDGNSGSTRKALTGGAVVLIQGGLALALINGFAVTFFEKEKPPHLASEFFPTKPVTPDLPPPPTAEPDQKLVRDTPISAPLPRLDITPKAAITGVTVDPMPVSGATEFSSDFVLPSTAPSEPAARFTPKVARPRGNVAGWVTTADYPTADIRAGNTGTVRFRLAIDADGRVSGCTVTQSSGFPGLDAATCRNVTRRARFDAASDATGGRAAGTYDGTIRWVIPND
ncbi:TonB family protein [Novosphingobium resinovorum]|uniref:energy transducer TonB n=1 Tax=Sphingomonadaceae TaxID=41297 RepID=UPI00027CA02E|nr:MULTISPECIES: energy transducer TonB [Sphingomonadaceae]EJU10530.1 hypothetical protein LH128_23451 [Sphingomonas sp. LH128]MBF7012336.1 TonB family protein [Novosphingobium sp. HR1a]WJM27077.1 TonB family protein [Novosphingobium resinovorum]